MSGWTTTPMQVEAFEDTSLLTFASMADITGFAHCVTTRPWNMAVHRGPQADLAAARRQRICEHLGLSFANLTAADQIHSAHVIEILPEDFGSGRDSRRTVMKFVDGMVCGSTGGVLLQFSADCPMLLAVDPTTRVFGTAHASWRGTVAQIAEELVRQLSRRYSVAPANLIVGLAPCAGPMRYEVGPEVRRVATARDPEMAAHFPTRDGRLYFDMRSANAVQLVRAGVRPEAITVAEECTLSDPRFYSHRRDGEDTGRFGVIAGFVA